MAHDDFEGSTWVTYNHGEAVALCLRRCRLSVISGPDQGQTADFEQRCIQIGARCRDLALNDSKVSGIHCEIVMEDGGFLLRDLGSRNGTLVAGHLVREVFLNNGSEIQIGNTRLGFQLFDDGESIALWPGASFGGLVGKSPPMRALFSRLSRIATTDLTVLITGETGTGKDVAAETIHEASARVGESFVVFDCGSVSPNLIESYLFGHERGAFTGAVSARAGVFERAHKGTLFLDEIGELPMSLQPKLLRALDKKQVIRIGSDAVIDCDVRLLAATNRNLAEEVNARRFREDLYYRLAVAELHLPPLRERKEDIPLLVRHLSERISKSRVNPFSQETLKMLAEHQWPGNVRELKNMVERAVLLDETPTSVRSLERRGLKPANADAGGDANSASQDATSESILRLEIDLSSPFKNVKRDLLLDFERAYVTRVLEKNGFNVSAAAREAGVDRMTIHKVTHRLGIEIPGRARDD